MGVTDQAALGIDTENIHSRQAPIDIAENFFSTDEVATLRRLPIEKQNEGFYSYWTLKEAYIKARGVGLSVALDKFSIDLSVDRQIDVSYRPPLTDQPDNWQFKQFWLSTDHLAAVCMARCGETNPHWDATVRLSVPAARRELPTCPLIRQSI